MPVTSIVYSENRRTPGHISEKPWSCGSDWCRQRLHQGLKKRRGCYYDDKNDNNNNQIMKINNKNIENNNKKYLQKPNN